MKLGDNRWHWKYMCDKCGKEIQYIGQKGFVGINHYYKSTQRTTPKRDFDYVEWLKDNGKDDIKKMIELISNWIINCKKKEDK